MPVIMLLITMLSKSPRVGQASPSKWHKWLLNGVVLTTYNSWGWSSKWDPPFFGLKDWPWTYWLCQMNIRDNAMLVKELPARTASEHLGERICLACFPAMTFSIPGIQSYCQRMIWVSNHLFSIVFRFHSHSQKVIGSLGVWRNLGPIVVWFYIP